MGEPVDATDRLSCLAQGPASSRVERSPLMSEENAVAREPVKNEKPGLERYMSRSSWHLRGMRDGWKATAVTALLLSLPGCQSISGSASLSQVRIIDASPDAAGLDFYQGSGILAYNLGLGSITSYVPIPPGSYPVSANSAGTKQQLVTAPGTFLASSQYTVLISNTAATLQETILKDQSTPAPVGQVSLRFIDESLRAGPVDLYLVPTGSNVTKVSPVLTGVIFGANSGYVNVPTGTYTLIALPAGATPTAAGTTLFTSAANVYAAGSAKTLVLIDQQLLTTPGIQVITADDYDSPTQTTP